MDFSQLKEIHEHLKKKLLLSDKENSQLRNNLKTDAILSQEQVNKCKVCTCMSTLNIYFKEVIKL